MIFHIALYTFRKGVGDAEIDRFSKALTAHTNMAGLAHWYDGGHHLPLPADEAVRDSVYDFAAVWIFPSIDKLDQFSKHPAIVDFEIDYARPMVDKLAIANFAGITGIDRTLTNVFPVEERE